MSKEYNKEIRMSKAKQFFKSVLRNNHEYLISSMAIEPLSNILAEQLIQKLERESNVR